MALAVYSTDHWLVTDAPEPLPGTRYHWVLTPRAGLSPDAKAEFWPVLHWLRSRYKLTYFCLGARSWEHGMHVVVADGTPAEGVRFDCGVPPG